MKILSIVIPSYNTEKFIDKNLPTFLHDSILDDIEILIINDGSQDDTEKIAKKYEVQFPQAIQVISKKNGGHGSVINKGIETATGKYFKVVDGDDWVETENLVKLIKDLKRIEADLIINSYYIVYENKKKEISFKQVESNKSLIFENEADKFQKLPIHAITFRTSILKNNNIRVRENCFYEDNEYDLFPIPYIKSFIILDYPIYNYLMAQVNQSVSDTNSLKNHNMFYTVIKDCIKFYDEQKKYLPVKINTYILNTLLELIRSQYNIYLRNGFNKNSYDKFSQFNKELKNNYDFYYKKVIENNLYIKLLSRDNKYIFMMFTLMIKIYKYLTR